MVRLIFSGLKKTNKVTKGVCLQFSYKQQLTTETLFLMLLQKANKKRRNSERKRAKESWPHHQLYWLGQVDMDRATHTHTQ